MSVLFLVTAANNEKCVDGKFIVVLVSVFGRLWCVGRCVGGLIESEGCVGGELWFVVDRNL